MTEDNSYSDIMSGEETKRFIFRDSSIIRSPALMYLTDEHLRDVILENNGYFEIVRDAKEMGSILYCKNKPRDMLVYGVIWEELDE